MTNAMNVDLKLQNHTPYKKFFGVPLVVIDYERAVPPFPRNGMIGR